VAPPATTLAVSAASAAPKATAKSAGKKPQAAPAGEASCGAGTCGGDPKKKIL
jgi:uncharacterized low-complexity protein